MKKEDLRIVYMGTPDFAVESLRCLVEGGYNVVGVITMPDKLAGRGHKLQFSPVKQYALEQNLPLLQPEKLKDEVFVEALREWKADLQIVVAFRRWCGICRVWELSIFMLLFCPNTGEQLPLIGQLSMVIQKRESRLFSCVMRLIQAK